MTKKYNMLTPIEVVGKRGTSNVWKCLCDCGNYTNVVSGKLFNGYTKSCGCLSKHMLFDCTFGRLIVLGMDAIHASRWVCLCECGNIKSIATGKLISKKTTSCGCYRKKISTDRINAINHSGRMSGENHPQWRGGITDERKNDANRQWRMAIFDRDDFICQICESKNTYLNAHHIFNYSNHKEFIYDIDNGITMCSDCHKFFHSAYGNNVGDIELQDFIDKRWAYDHEW